MILKRLILREIKERLDELKLDDLITQLGQQRTQNFYHRADHIDFMKNEADVHPVFKEFKNGILHFTHDSSGEWKETQDETYDAFVKFFEWKNMVNMAQVGKSSKEITDVLYDGDLGIFCGCHDFWYRYSYAATQKGAAIVFQRIPSPITNPGLFGVGCKHLDAILNKTTIRFNYGLVKNQ